MGFISVADLASSNVKKSSHNHETYRMLYEQCISHIRTKHVAGYTETYWIVPEFVLGRGLFDVQHAIRYITEKLKLGGFEVDLVQNSTMLHISWRASLRQAIRDKQYSDKIERKKQKEKSSQKNDEPLSVKLQRLAKTIKLK